MVEVTGANDTSTPALTIRATIAPRLNVAFHQNSVPAITEIEIINHTECDYSDLSISVTSVPEFLYPKIFSFDNVRAGATHRLNPVSVDLDPKFLLGVTEAVRGDITFSVEASGVQLDHIRSCQVLAPNEWSGLATSPELVAAFVRPNDPAVDAILRNAAEKLRRAQRDPSLDGYQSGKKARAWELAEAIWAAFVDERIIYALPPQSFEQNGQKVRSPSALIERKVGTCLDLTLGFAACLEQAGLNPLVVFSDGHAFCGLWLGRDEFSSCVVYEAQTMRKRLQLQELILIETTLLTQQPPVRFKSAVEKAATFVSEDAEKPFELAVDIKRARHRQVKPLDDGKGCATAAAILHATAGTEATIDNPPNFTEEIRIAENVDETLNRLERWKRKLLDLSLRNKLLNFKAGKTALTLSCHDPGALEDKLAAGDKLKLLAKPNVMSGSDPRSAEIHFRQTGDDAAMQYAADAFQRGDVHTNATEDELEDRLTEIFRAARSSFEEGGANSLHLAIGFVSWTPQGKETKCKAPLLLMPAALERRTIRSGFRLVRHDDDARINPTLLQMLRQDFKLVIPEFERDLPTDASGLDVPQIWRIARSHLKDVKGFELTEEVVLSNFSFVKYLMWKDLVDRTEVLKRNPVVRHLIDTPKDTYGNHADMPDERRIDQDVEPQNLFMPLLADSSQTAAVIAASRGKDFVLFGPPGTGKSQTIANIIVQLLGDGKTVLFVSQKTTALEVVRKRLNDNGLGSYCLEVHSAKAQKSAVLGQLKSAWDSRSTDAVHEWDHKTSDLKSLRDRLNAVVASLHRRYPNGLTAHEAMGRVIAGHEFAPGLTLPFFSAEGHDTAAMRGMRENCHQLKTALSAVGDPSVHALRGLGRTVWSPVWQSQLLAAIERFRLHASSLVKSCAVLARIFGVPVSGNPVRIHEILVFAEQALKPEALDAVGFLSGSTHLLQDTFRLWKADMVKYSEAEKRLICKYREGALALDLSALLNEWRDAINSLILVRNSRKRRVWDALAPFTDDKMPDDLGTEIADLIAFASARNKACSHDTILGSIGEAWLGMATEVKRIDMLFAWEAEVRAEAARLATSEQSAQLWVNSIASILHNRRDELTKTGAIRAAVRQVLNDYKAFDITRNELAGLAETSDEWLGLPLTEDWLLAAVVVVCRWSTAYQQAQRWCAWCAAASSAEKLGLNPLIEALSTGLITQHDVENSFELGYARWWIEQIVDRDTNLSAFVDVQHEDAISRFVKLDEQVADLSRRVVSGRLCGNIPARTAFGRDPEFGTLSREIEKRVRHIPLRQLFSQMPTALTKLAPCVMMSPLSIAQFLPADSRPFDVVIFDEASQIPVWDAIGAIARGKQVVVVGDPKQLPPTSFFDRGDDGYDDAADVEDLDSILDECLGANIPHIRLSWHYRSRHESLIAFSNERYYDGRLVTFPSPVTDDRAVRYVHVPGGVYERGGGRVNRAEARAVASEVVRRLSDTGFAARKSSIGIVTFNTEQQRLIENLLDQERRARPDLERFFAADWHEPVFVKNLESVQGDEREVILFSVGYGPDASGRFAAQISTLNKDGGERRLNVAITRARSELLVFATLRAEQIDLSRTKSIGIRDFKHFLEYAERGPRALAQASAPLDRGTDSPFEDAVIAKLETLGWIVHPQVGVSGFRIDLGVVHPDAPGRYLAGVECDGATYHRSATARDRDRLRERVLRDLGWQIRRVWSTDWWVDAPRALAKLHEGLLEDLEKDRGRVASEKTANSISVSVQVPEVSVRADGGLQTSTSADLDNQNELPEPTLIEEPFRKYADIVVLEPPVIHSPFPAATDINQYKIADFQKAGLIPRPETFYDTAYRPVLRRMTAQVIATEGPIFDDLLVRRIARAHGFARAAGRIRETVLDVVEYKFPRTMEDDRKIFWPENSDTVTVFPFRRASLEERDHTDIPLAEIASLAKSFLEQGSDAAEAAILIGRELGLGRLREAARVRFELAAKMAQKAVIGTI